MIKKYLFVIFFCWSGVIKAQESVAVSFDIPYQNALKYNRFLMNPAFSFVGEDQSYINFYHRSQWMRFDDSPKVYFINYSGKINERAGAGLGMYQQKLGIFTNFGAIANYAYNVKFNEKNGLTFGFNVVYYNSGIDNGRVQSEELDPSIQLVGSDSFIALHPGINLTLGSFDIGIYAENLVDYNITESHFLKEFSGRKFAGHLMYTKRLENAEGLFENGKATVITRGESAEKQDFRWSLGAVLDLPKTGWVQAGYDDFYGMSYGVGFHLSQRLSLGYIYENGTNNNISRFGVTHEIVFAYAFKAATKGEKVEQKASAAHQKALKENSEQSQEIKEKTGEETKGETGKGETGKGVPGIMPKEQGSELTETKSGPVPASIDEMNQEIAEQKPKTQKYSKNRVLRQNFEGVEPGYYLIVNVYEQEENLYSFMDQLSSEGFNTVSYFTDQKTNLKYVYLKRYDTLQEILPDYRSDFNHLYDGPKWILHVDKSL